MSARPYMPSFAEFMGDTPMPACTGEGILLLPVGPRDQFGNQDTAEYACPGCENCEPER